MKLSITSLPLARVKSPVWLRTTLRLGCLATTPSNPFLRFAATLAPTVPCISTTLQVFLPAVLGNVVSASRQPDSEQIWEEPMDPSAATAGTERVVPAKAVEARRDFQVMRRVLPRCLSGRLHHVTGVQAPFRLPFSSSKEYF